MKTIRDDQTIHDKVAFAAGNEKVVLRVDKNGRAIVADLKNALTILQSIADTTDETQVQDAAMAYASAIFGEGQALKLFELYGTPVSVVNVCGQYFANHLQKKITRTQKKR